VEPFNDIPTASSAGYSTNLVRFQIVGLSQIVADLWPQYDDLINICWYVFDEVDESMILMNLMSSNKRML